MVGQSNTISNAELWEGLDYVPRVGVAVTKVKQALQISINGLLNALHRELAELHAEDGCLVPCCQV